MAERPLRPLNEIFVAALKMLTGNECDGTSCVLEMEQISVVTIGGGLDKVLLRRFTDEWTEKCPAFFEVWCPEYGLAKYEKRPAGSGVERINGRDWKEAQEYIHAGKLDGDFLKKVKSDTFVFKSEQTFRFSALSIVGAAHVLKKAGPGHQSPTFYTCSCPKFWHYYKCKHVLALAIRLKHALVPENTIILPFRKRGRGRGAKAHGGEALSAKPARHRGRGRGRN
ncbi:hypothetical protein CTAYLR_001753 [Chrysophaeum taylorii]|uniref:SWIM-type domain-containing protein n=1 Tax=Chrysophaeum taylorii TaxID=2483200 RepID=A0AAD7UEP4_9STRA|nr:hypothetical protein CTAYLR_001753 [Chrysophaeum taylorii]